VSGCPCGESSKVNSAKFKSSPAGLAGRKVRTPRRAFFVANRNRDDYQKHREKITPADPLLTRVEWQCSVPPLTIST